VVIPDLIGDPIHVSPSADNLIGPILLRRLDPHPASLGMIGSPIKSGMTGGELNTNKLGICHPMAGPWDPYRFDFNCTKLDNCQAIAWIARSSPAMTAWVLQII
jgi:hypothetical protein